MLFYRVFLQNRNLKINLKKIDTFVKFIATFITSMTGVYEYD